MGRYEGACIIMLIRYEVEFWDEIDHQLRIEKGLTVSKTSLGEGVDKIAEYYGKNNISFIKVYECEDCMCDEELKDLLAE
jgi:hypothetical protein